MAYEIFTKKVVRTGTPVLSFAKGIGQIRFNQRASEILQKDAVEHVLLLWDAAESKLALKATTNKKDPRAYHIKYATNNNGSGFSAKTFLDYIGVDYHKERRSIPVEINTNNEYLMEVKLPDSFLLKKGQPLLLLKEA